MPLLYNFAAPQPIKQRKMEYKAKYITEDIKLSCYEDKFFKSDIVFEHHMLIWFLSGATKIVQADATYIFKAGDIFLIPRNQLATIINYPADGLPHKTVVMHLSAERLIAYYQNLDIQPQPSRPPGILRYSNHPLLQSCLSSLIPYFDMNELPDDIASLKITEAISILRAIDKKVDHVLGEMREIRG